MSRATFATFIGVFNAIVCLIVVLISAFGMLASVGLAEQEEESVVKALFEDESNESNELTGKEAEKNIEALGFVAIVSCLFFIVYLFLFITSVFMVVGVRKQRHQYMAPWIYLSAIALIIEVYQVAEYLKKRDSEFVWYALGAVVEAAIWYPIFKHYYALKHPRVVQAVAAAAAASPMTVHVPTVESSPPLAEFNHATAKYVPTTVMIAAPQQQGQIVYPSVPAASSYFTYKV